MHIVAIVLLAGIAGAIFSWISPIIQAKLPASLPQGKIAQAFVVGFIVLLSIWAASLIIGVIGMRTSKA